MNLQQNAPPRSSANGFNRRRIDNKSQAGQSNFNKMSTAGDRGEVDSPSRERLVFLTTCLIGHQVEVQVADGSVFSGIFHATNAENDFGIILKMASVTKAGSSHEHKNISDVNKPASKTLIIPSRDLVQIVAKNVPITRDGIMNEFQHEKQQDIMTDSSISRSRHVELERELEPWVPDDDSLECPELDNTFDRHWNRGWDQFETNAALFGVTSTFDEELYTTKLDRGPQMREREKEAIRIAREIEGEDTQDLHLAEERGIHFHSGFDLDEETKYSSVYRGVDGSGYDENEDIWDSENIETFGDASDSAMNNSFTDSENRIQDNHSNQQKVESHHTKEDTEKHMLFEQHEAGNSEDTKKESYEKGLSADARAYAPSSNKAKETMSISELSEGASAGKTREATQPASSSGLSPSSSMGSMNSEKSTLNPNAKEFRPNPNAKSFVPVQTPIRATSPVSDGPFYYPNVAPVSHMPVGIAMGTSFVPHQPVIYGPQTTSYQSQQSYFQSNVPQHMPLGQSRQMVYMPTYPPEMPYKGRDF